MSYFIVWNENKTEGFVTNDEGLAYEVRKGSDTNCFNAEGELSSVGVAFIDAWIDDNCTMEKLVDPGEVERLRIALGNTQALLDQANYHKAQRGETIAEPSAPVERDEPVAWFTEDHLTDKSATTWDSTVADRWRAKGWPVGELFARAALSASAKLSDVGKQS